MIQELIAGSVIVKFTILPSTNQADPLVNQVVANLQTQIADTSSTLYTGSVTSDVNTETLLHIEEEIMDEISSAPASSIALDIKRTYNEMKSSSLPTNLSRRLLRRLAYQTKGLFEFQEPLVTVTENMATVDLVIRRRHGAEGQVTLLYHTLDGTAKAGLDYVGQTGQMIFRHDERQKVLSIELLDDAQVEAHFERFSVVIDPPGVSGADTTSSSVLIQIYDYDDGDRVASRSFHKELEEEDDESPPSSSWSIVGNGKLTEPSSSWIDATLGLYALDRVVGKDEYNDQCNFASPSGPCDHSCAFGGGYALTHPLSGQVSGVLSLLPAAAAVDDDDDDHHHHSASTTTSEEEEESKSGGYVLRERAFDSFPTDEISLSFWIRLSHASVISSSSTVLSYVTETGKQAWSLYNPHNLHLVIDAPVKSDFPGLATSISLSSESDNTWHHITVCWRSSDGRVHAYLDGVHVFEGGPYRSGLELPKGGSLVLGQRLLSPCVLGGECTFAGPEANLPGEFQHIRLWNRFLSSKDVVSEVQWPYPDVPRGLILYWRFEHEFTSGNVVYDQVNLNEEDHADDETTFENTHARLVSARLVSGSTPSLSPFYPCGHVYANIWHFQAPEVNKWSGDLSELYGGRLQFRMLAASHNGSPRSKRGWISITNSVNGQEATFGLQDFDLPVASRWTYYSVILREDFGWIVEPTGRLLSTSEMKHWLGHVASLRIRGDHWVYSTQGYGQELVYLQDVVLFRP